MQYNTVYAVKKIKKEKERELNPFFLFPVG
jgi:hypothetical protein